MKAKEKPEFSVPEISDALGFRREDFHPDELLSDPEFPLDYPESRPEDKYSEWNRPDLRSFTEAIGAAWENDLSERYDMEIVRNGPVDLRVTEGVFENSPVQAKNACIINSKGQRADGTWRSRPGLVYVKRPEMKALAETDLDNIEGLDEEEYSSPALLHAAVHYPQEDMPDLPEEVPVKEIESPDGRDYSFETAYIGEIIVPIAPMYQENRDSFNSGSRQAWPLEWPTVFGEKEEDENFMQYWNH